MKQTNPEDAPSVLVVDDNLANLQTLVGMLRDQGYRARPVSDGELALEVARTEPPDLILLDILMPGMDGYEVCERLKADAQLAEVPVIFVSALTETMDKVKAFAVGGVDYVTKPFQFEEVQARVTTHLRLRRLQTDLENRNRQLQESYEQLRQIEELRDNLVHMIVHDLRSPLMGIHGNLDLLDLLEAKHLSEKGNKHLSEARSSGETLIEMINSLLDVSRMEAGEMPLHRTECDLVRLAREVLARMEPLRGRRQLTLDAPEAPVTLTADPDLLSRVLQNLVGNALKFTPADGRVRVGLEPGEETVRVCVQDTGRGIPAEYHEKIFEKFGQVEARANGQKYSTGLGLTFCKMAVEAHGGKIGVDSAVGQGSTFWFALPTRGPQPTGPLVPHEA